MRDSCLVNHQTTHGRNADGTTYLTWNRVGQRNQWTNAMGRKTVRERILAPREESMDVIALYGALVSFSSHVVLNLDFFCPLFQPG